MRFALWGWRIPTVYMLSSHGSLHFAILPRSRGESATQARPQSTQHVSGGSLVAQAAVKSSWHLVSSFECDLASNFLVGAGHSCKVQIMAMLKRWKAIQQGQSIRDLAGLCGYLLESASCVFAKLVRCV